MSNLQIICNDSEEDGPGEVYGKVQLDISKPFE